MKLIITKNSVPKYFTGVCITLNSNAIRYFKDGKHHREDGPAIEHANGFKNWIYKNRSYGRNGYFTNQTWKEKVKKLKYLGNLEIFK